MHLDKPLICPHPLDFMSPACVPRLLPGHGGGGAALRPVGGMGHAPPPACASPVPPAALDAVRAPFDGLPTHAAPDPDSAQLDCMGCMFAPGPQRVRKHTVHCSSTPLDQACSPPGPPTACHPLTPLAFGPRRASLVPIQRDLTWGETRHTQRDLCSARRGLSARPARGQAPSRPGEPVGPPEPTAVSRGLISGRRRDAQRGEALQGSLGPARACNFHGGRLQHYWGGGGRLRGACRPPWGERQLVGTHPLLWGLGSEGAFP